MFTTKLTNVEVKKRTSGKWGVTYEVTFDCLGSCGERLTRSVNAEKAPSKADAVAYAETTSLTCWNCEWKGMNTDQRAQYKIDELVRDIRYRREKLQGELEHLVKSANDELTRMAENPEYVPFVNSMVNWTLNAAKGCDETAKDVTEAIVAIRHLQSVQDTPKAIVIEKRKPAAVEVQQ